MGCERMTTLDSYDELPYQCLPIEWTAPERLAVASLLHGGPRCPIDGYTVLELGCGDGSNLLPQAYYRRHARFVGVDGARSQIEIAKSSMSELALSNVEFIHSDFLDVDDKLSGQFDYIIGHGIFSWVSQRARDALLQVCAKRLRGGGLLYLNYNANPGWKVRGMVRDFLLAQTAEVTSLRDRAEAAQDVAAKIVASLPDGDHAYSRLLANEFRFVCENHISYVAHEYLAADNQSYWRSEFLSLARLHGFEYVADADFNYSSGRLSESLVPTLVSQRIAGRSIDDTVDLLCYRQLHSPILTNARLTRLAPSVDEFADLLVASCLEPCALAEAGNPMFQHPSGYQVEAKEHVIRIALDRLWTLWPRGLPIGEVFADVDHVRQDLILLHRNGLIDLRCVEIPEYVVNSERLRRLESRKGYFTTSHHTRVAAVA
jgi:SAM-dependent methyltransferase